MGVPGIGIPDSSWQLNWEPGPIVCVSFFPQPERRAHHLNVVWGLVLPLPQPPMLNVSYGRRWSWLHQSMMPGLSAVSFLCPSNCELLVKENLLQTSGLANLWYPILKGTSLPLTHLLVDSSDTCSKCSHPSHQSLTFLLGKCVTSFSGRTLRPSRWSCQYPYLHSILFSS